MMKPLTDIFDIESIPDYLSTDLAVTIQGYGLARRGTRIRKFSREILFL